MERTLFVAAVAYAIMSLIAFVAMWRDKRAAIAASRNRTPEASLHALELLGGWPGSLLAQQLFRHKTRKLHYLMVLWLIVALHAAGWGAAVFLFWS